MFSLINYIVNVEQSALGLDIISVIYSQEPFFVSNYVRVFLFSRLSSSKAVYRDSSTTSVLFA